MKKFNRILFKTLFMGLFFAQFSACQEAELEIENTLPPAWAEEVIWYQIFVERFHNGDTSNDPRPVDIAGAYANPLPANWKTTPWGQDWYADDYYFPALDSAKDWNGNPINNFDAKLQFRRYGGDLAGVLQKLDYLDSLGVTALYFNPINDAPSLHKYDARHWRHIDINFGPSPDADKEIIAQEDPADPSTWRFTSADSLFLKLINAVHQRGMRLIIDYSWNHTGNEFWAWQDVLEKQEASAYRDWYWVKNWDNPTTDSNEFAYRGWFGMPTLPEIKETHAFDHSADIQAFEGNVYSEAVKDHIFAITKRWLDPNGDGDPEDGVDGFRLDVAAEIPLGFWRDYRKVVKELNPQAYLIGEVWWKKFPHDLLNPAPYLEGDIFDAVMNYRWYRAARSYFNPAPDSSSAKELTDSLISFSRNLRYGSSLALMNISSSHDVPRLSTSLHNNNLYKFDAKVSQDPRYKINKPDAYTLRKQKALLLHQYSYVGAPQIYGGDEMGMWGADDPDNRKPLIWPELEFQNESEHPLGLDRPSDVVVFDSTLFNYYRDLISMRRRYQALQKGKLEFFRDFEKQGLLVYERTWEAEHLLCIFNNTQQTKIWLYPSAKADYKVVMSSAAMPEKREDGGLAIAPLSGLIVSY
jgi:cyclomaltodextrinase